MIRNHIPVNSTDFYHSTPLFQTQFFPFASSFPISHISYTVNRRKISPHHTTPHIFPSITTTHPYLLCLSDFCLPVCRCVFVYLFVYLSVYLPVCLSLCLSVCLSSHHTLNPLYHPILFHCIICNSKQASPRYFVAWLTTRWKD